MTLELDVLTSVELQKRIRDAIEKNMDMDALAEIKLKTRAARNLIEATIREIDDGDLDVAIEEERERVKQAIAEKKAAKKTASKKTKKRKLKS